MSQKFHSVSTNYVVPYTSENSSVKLQKGLFETVTTSSLSSPSATLYNSVIQNISKITGGINGKISVKEYGAVGDGITDDTSAIQSAINVAKTNGYNLFFPPGTYIISNTLDISYNIKSFTLSGSGWSSIIKMKTAGVIPVTGAWLDGLIVENLLLDGNHRGSGAASHGFNIKNPNNVLFRNVKVMDYLYTAILVYLNNINLAGDFRNVWILDCDIDGYGVSANGVLMESMFESGIIGTCVRNVLFSANPSLGLQLKNRCERCFMVNSTVESCGVGISFGNNTSPAEMGVRYCVVSNCITKNCLYGIQICQGIGNIIDNITIDMSENPFMAWAVDLMAGWSTSVNSRENVIKGILVKGMVSTKNVVYVGAYAENNYIEIDHISDSAHTKFADFVTPSKYNTIVIRSRADLIDTEFLSQYYTNTGTNNDFVLKNSTTGTTILPSVTASAIENTSTTNYEIINCTALLKAVGGSNSPYSIVTLPSTGAISCMTGFLMAAGTTYGLAIPCMQLPNSWRDGSKIYIQFHIILTTIPTVSTDTAKFALEWAKVSPGSASPTTTQSTAVDVNFYSLGITSEGYHYVGNLFPIGLDMTGVTRGAFISMRFSRVWTATHYAGDVYLTGFELKYNPRFITGQ